MDLRNTWCSRDSEFFDEYCGLIRDQGVAFKPGKSIYHELHSMQAIECLHEEGRPKGVIYNTDIAEVERSSKEFKGTKIHKGEEMHNSVVIAKTPREKHMCEMLLRKMRGEGVEVKMKDGEWCTSATDFVDVNHEYRATPEREFVVGEAYPCVDEDGDDLVYKYIGDDEFSSTHDRYKCTAADMQFIGQSLGAVKFKP